MTDWGLIDPGATDPIGTDDDAVLDALVEVEQGLLRSWGRGARRTARGAGAGARRDGARSGSPSRGSRARRGPGRGARAACCAHRSRRTACRPIDCTSARRARTSSTRRSCSCRSARSPRHAPALVAPAARSHRSPTPNDAACASVARSPATARRAPLGVLAAGWLDGVALGDRGDRRTAFPVQFGGAVGTGTAADAAAGSTSGADDVRAELADLLGLADPGRSWHTERTPVLAIASTAAAVVAALGRIAGDITFLSREEVGEVRLAGGGGSSAMPHKRNPVAAVADHRGGGRGAGAAAGRRERRDRRRRAVAAVAGTPSGPRCGDWRASRARRRMPHPAS